MWARPFVLLGAIAGLAGIGLWILVTLLTSAPWGWIGTSFLLVGGALVLDNHPVWGALSSLSGVGFLVHAYRYEPPGQGGESKTT